MCICVCVLCVCVMCTCVHVERVCVHVYVCAHVMCICMHVLCICVCTRDVYVCACVTCMCVRVSCVCKSLPCATTSTFLFGSQTWTSVRWTTAAVTRTAPTHSERTDVCATLATCWTRTDTPAEVGQTNLSSLVKGWKNGNRSDWWNMISDTRIWNYETIKHYTMNYNTIIILYILYIYYFIYTSAIY